MTNEEFKDKLKALGYTQKSFAEQQKIPYGTVKDWAQGRNQIRPVLIALLREIEKNQSAKGL